MQQQTEAVAESKQKPPAPKSNKPRAGDLELYDIVVNIGGQILHTVRKEGVTAAEIALIRAKHGNDSVISCEDTNKIFKPARKKRLAEERPNIATEAQRLKDIYGPRAFAHIFGAGMANALPRVVGDLPSEIAMFDPPKEKEAA